MPVDDSALEALAHLQRAALEMIQAARSALDLVEGIVADPQSLAAIVAGVGQLAQAVVAAASSPHPPAHGPRPPGSAEAEAEESWAARADPHAEVRREGSGVERIPVL
jgi:hypothetical protein